MTTGWQWDVQETQRKEVASSMSQKGLQTRRKGGIGFEEYSLQGQRLSWMCRYLSQILSSMWVPLLPWILAANCSWRLLLQSLALGQRTWLVQEVRHLSSPSSTTYRRCPIEGYKMLPQVLHRTLCHTSFLSPPPGLAPSRTFSSSSLWRLSKFCYREKGRECRDPLSACF